MTLLNAYANRVSKGKTSHLQSGHSNRDTWKKIVQSQCFRKTKDSQVYLQTAQ